MPAHHSVHQKTKKKKKQKKGTFIHILIIKSVLFDALVSDTKEAVFII